MPADLFTKKKSSAIEKTYIHLSALWHVFGSPTWFTSHTRIPYYNCYFCKSFVAKLSHSVSGRVWLGNYAHGLTRNVGGSGALRPRRLSPSRGFVIAEVLLLYFLQQTALAEWWMWQMTNGCYSWILCLHTEKSRSIKTKTLRKWKRYFTYLRTERQIMKRAESLQLHDPPSCVSEPRSRTLVASSPPHRRYE